MDKLKDFKSMADEIMSDINAGEDLKRRTLAQCGKKNHILAGKVLIPAACLLLTFGLLNISGILPLKSQTAKEENTEINVLLDGSYNTAQDTEAMPDSAADAQLQDNSEAITWTLSTTAEAGEVFGSAFLIPAYVPEDYQLDQIQASGSDESNADQITLSYRSGDKVFYIVEEKSALEEGFSEYKVIFINGIPGYINVEDETGTGSPYTDLHWFTEGVHYCVSGQITEEEAVKAAGAMT
jgi:hypothetical protein